MKTHTHTCSLAFLVPSALLAAAGCGSTSVAPDGGVGTGSGGSGGSDAAPTVDRTPVTMSCGDPNAPIDPTAALDDMEDDNFTILMIGGRNGSWWAGGDATPGGQIVPMGDATPEAIPGGRCGSHYAQRVTGQGFNDWGSLISMSFKYGSVDGSAPGLLPYDAHIRTGITFWARIGDTSTNRVRFSLSDKHARPEAGLCDPNGGIGTQCYDNFGVQLTQLDTTWRQYRIPFGGLTQRNFGLQAPEVDATTLYTVEFAFDGGAIFDFWVDDISFY